MIKLIPILQELKYDVYRGDDSKFKHFDVSYIGKSTGVDTIGFWFTNNESAAEFFGQYTRKFTIIINNPYIVTSEMFINNSPKGPTYWAKKAKNSNHDGVIIQDIVDGNVESTVYCVFTNTQIISK